MIHAFLLMLYLGTGEHRTLESADMYFYDVNDCNYFAAKLARRYGNYRYAQYIDPKDRATAYCVPKYVNPTNVRIY